MFVSTLATLAAFTPLLTRVNGQVTATGPNGPTNPSAPAFAQVGSKVDQESMSRLISLNGVSRKRRDLLFSRDEADGEVSLVSSPSIHPSIHSFNLASASALHLVFYLSYALHRSTTFASLDLPRTINPRSETSRPRSSLTARSPGTGLGSSLTEL